MIEKIWRKLDKVGNYRHLYLWFLLIWFVVNILQALFTGLAHDEAYYWMYSRNIEWGFFDHPPMIALFIKLGYTLFPNELGVRFFSAICGTLVLYFVFQILKKDLKSISLLFVLLLTMIIVQSHIAGFLAIPDLPLVFFAALFFLLYKKYLVKDSWWLAIILGLVSVAMLYSKYHGILVLFFTLLSNFKILRRYSFWLIPTIIVIGMLPHLFWQIENDFPTFSYHLVGRSSAYSIDRTLNYIAGQLLIAGPFVGVLLFYHSVKAKSDGDFFLKAMKYNFYGFFLLFLLSSFKGHVEPHWTAVGFIPVIILSYRSMINNERAKKWMRILFIPSILAFVALRFFLIVDTGLLPKSNPQVNEFHNWDKWADKIKEKAEGRKVVFVNSFQAPSKYSFYTGGDFSHTLNSIHYRQNQYDIWGLEKELQNEDILLVGTGRPMDTILTEVGRFHFREMNNFKSYYDIRIEPDLNEIRLKPNESIVLNAAILNTREEELVLESADQSPVQLGYTIYRSKTFIGTTYLQSVHCIIPVGGSLPIQMEIEAPKISGKYYCYLSIFNNELWAPFNSIRIDLIVE